MPGRAISGPTHAPPARSLRQQYQEFLLQRIEEYKDGLTREELLHIGDEAITELEPTVNEQYVLTEVLLLEHVDRIIMRRLKLPSYRRWRAKYVALRQAQREPTHWGLEPDSVLISRARRLTPGATVLVVGAARTDIALYLAALEAQVTLVDQDLAIIELAENRAATEQLAAQLEAFVVRFGGWLPPCRPELVVLDPSTLSDLSASTRNALFTDLKAATPKGGTHIILPTHAFASLPPEALNAHYRDWIVERASRGGNRRQGFAATCPACPNDTQAVSN